MGIEHFWPLLGASARRVDGKSGELRGKRIGVDMSVLMHGAYSTESI